ncbi:N-terminal phage integrase SAM-like domain-containing protein [Streptomyces chromofuscus]|uniref:N-terminal phage integrase SAM-like domain-containing protein n=1 Tax=Streptomyces chromofuscus TaxID=42881 RepID=UPI0019A2CEDB|nr:N-terminal phage integrase SAM-like domain-containing protein [Streptomyces chromofuscus]GGT00715.1 hypothetical protein GCM10010254_21040 [Streptomyces chromofuscus]
MTIGEYLTYWLVNVARGKVRRTTYVNYESLVRNYVTPECGRKKLARLTARDIRAFLTKTATTCQCCAQGGGGRRSGGGDRERRRPRAARDQGGADAGEAGREPPRQLRPPPKRKPAWSPRPAHRLSVPGSPSSPTPSANASLPGAAGSRWTPSPPWATANSPTPGPPSYADAKVAGYIARYSTKNAEGAGTADRTLMCRPCAVPIPAARAPSGKT